ncbi:hypothetical protein ACVGX7_16055, partial [Enterobacter hormaechei]
QELRDIVAWRLMGTDVPDEQARWRDDAVMRSNSVSLVERRVGPALGTGDRRGLNNRLARLPMDSKHKKSVFYKHKRPHQKKSCISFSGLWLQNRGGGGGG